MTSCFKDLGGWGVVLHFLLVLRNQLGFAVWTPNVWTVLIKGPIRCWDLTPKMYEGRPCRGGGHSLQSSHPFTEFSPGDRQFQSLCLCQWYVVDFLVARHAKTWRTSHSGKKAWFYSYCSIRYKGRPCPLTNVDTNLWFFCWLALLCKQLHNLSLWHILTLKEVLLLQREIVMSLIRILWMFQTPVLIWHTEAEKHIAQGLTWNFSKHFQPSKSSWINTQAMNHQCCLRVSPLLMKTPVSFQIHW